MKKTTKWLLTIAAIFLLIALTSNIQLISYVFGEVQYRKSHLQPGNISVPHERTMAWKNQSAFADSIINDWAIKTIPANLDGKGSYPRTILAKLIAKRDIPEVNNTLLRMTAWGISGSSWALNKKGDYDFTITILTTILYKFGDQPKLLYPGTKDYLLNILLTEEGEKFRYSAPRTLGFVKETENHILMTEGSKYLKNQWKRNHGNSDPRFDNVRNGMEDKLLDFLEEMKINGLYEFNSLPYIGYTITALLNLEAFGSEKLKTEARNVLDYMNWTYALGSYQLKHYPPMRRRYEKAGITKITTNYQSIFMKSWLSFSPIGDYNKDISGGDVHALMGACMPYRPADKVVETIFNKGNGYFVKMGHGPESSPEIYFAGRHFLLSAGGVNRGKMSIIVARPITLFLNDQSDDLSQTFHLAGPGSDFMQWNNTGVYKNFACAAGPVFIPEKFKPVAENPLWKIYDANDSLLIVVHSSETLGIIALYNNRKPQELADELLKSNPDTKILKTQFRCPEGSKIEYDLNAPKNKWMIKSVNDQPLDRDFDKWPLIDGTIKS